MKNIIKILRAKENLTQEQLAKQIGISRPFLSDIENSKVIPNGRTVIKFANFFGLPAEQIFFEETVMHEEHNAI
jgi:putative transcriptional regulator